MVRMRLIAVTLACLLLMGAAAADAALASKGELVNSEGKALVKNKFKGVIGATAVETTGGRSVKCKAGTASGVETSKTEGEQTITYKECKSSVEGVSCNSPGQGSGVIELKEVKLSTLPAKFPGDMPLTYILRASATECAGVKGEIKGSYLSPVPSEGKLSTTYTFVSKQTKGVQEPSEYENTKGEKVKFAFEAALSGSELFEKAGVSGIEEFTFEESAEFI
jgi:hypothetical protein